MQPCECRSKFLSFSLIWFESKGLYIIINLIVVNSSCFLVRKCISSSKKEKSYQLSCHYWWLISYPIVSFIVESIYYWCKFIRPQFRELMGFEWSSNPKFLTESIQKHSISHKTQIQPHCPFRLKIVIYLFLATGQQQKRV
jgi:hypothetical protein